MSLDPLLIAELLALGCVGGFLAGLLGIGGGMLLVPALTFIASAQGFPADYVVKMAVATSLATILFTSLSSVRAHHKRGAIRWDVVKLLAPGVVAGSLLGAQIAKLLSTKTLALVFAVFVSYSALQMFIDKKPKPSRQLPQGVGMFGSGTLIGTLSALVGAGGGFISVPFMAWCNVPIHTAVATSAALGFPIALAGSMGYIFAGWDLQAVPAGSFGYLYLPALVLIAATSVLFAPLGAKAAHTLNVRQLKRVFACLLFVLAAYMASKGLAA
ncbi:sulfite exporter TauE/SafE family protein [Hydrogenophaga sp.]|uniref:sulfite exporter TauE/SafE family protein n=1 Tax=Hydrogenophaga sp. TaxID=1904254 RepID=UPI002FC897BB